MADQEEKEIDSLRQEVKALEAKISSIKPVVISLVPKNAPVSGTALAAPKEADQAQVSELKGRVDELQHQLDVIRADLEARKADKEEVERLERRVAALEQKPVSEAPAQKPIPAVIAVPTQAPAIKAVPEAEDDKLHISHVSFSEKILSASSDTIANYNLLRNYFVSYRSVTSRISLPCDSYRGHRKLYAKIVACQKSLKLYLALAIKDYKDSAVPLEDVSKMKTYQEVPCLLRVRSPLSIRRALKLIEEMLTKAGFVQKKEGPAAVDFTKEIRDQLQLEKAQKKQKNK
jgi:polyhydroxyalkanoate synthesis regulator phasin